MASAWFIAWAAGVLLLVCALVAVNAAAEYRRLRRGRTLRPLYVLWQKTGARLLPRGATGRNFEGRLAWVAWDIRWVSSGESMARVVSSQTENALVLRLDTPIVLSEGKSTPAVRLDRVSFVPSRSSLPHYERCAVSGKLEPAVTPGRYATAQIVVYPAGA